MRDGDGPDSFDHGAADEAFAAVVLDEDFVEAAAIHEPSAAERILYAALERAESEAAAAEPSYYPDPEFDPGLPEGLSGYPVDGGHEGGVDPDDPDEEGRFDRSDYTRYLPDEDDEDELSYGGYAPYAAAAPYAARSAAPGAGTWRPARWQRPVACVLAVVMGISVIAFALIAIQRAGSGQRDDTTPGPVSPASEPDLEPPAMLDGDLTDTGP